MGLGDRVVLRKPDGSEIPCRVLGQRNGVMMVCRDASHRLASIYKTVELWAKQRGATDEWTVDELPTVDRRICITIGTNSREWPGGNEAATREEREAMMKWLDEAQGHATPRQ
jgi:hypothetical protein